MPVQNKTQNIFTTPFKSPVPFPVTYIRDIKIALKKTSQVPFVTAISSNNNYFSLQIQTANSYLGNFVYNGNSWITLDNDFVFGFVLLNTTPVEKFTYSGKWQLQRACYTFPITLQGISNVSAQGLSIQKDQIYNIAVSGDLSIRKNKIQNSDSYVQVNIGRDLQPHLEYTQQNTATEDYIYNINGVQADSLLIYSSDSTIQIEQPRLKNNGIYIMYISTKKGFPKCAQWSDISNSNSDSLSSLFEV